MLYFFKLAPECPKGYKLAVSEKDGRSCFGITSGLTLFIIYNVTTKFNENYLQDAILIELNAYTLKYLFKKILLNSIQSTVVFKSIDHFYKPFILCFFPYHV